MKGMLSFVACKHKSDLCVQRKFENGTKQTDCDRFEEETLRANAHTNSVCVCRFQNKLNHTHEVQLRMRQTRF